MAALTFDNNRRRNARLANIRRSPGSSATRARCVKAGCGTAYSNHGSVSSNSAAVSHASTVSIGCRPPGVLGAAAVIPAAARPLSSNGARIASSEPIMPPQVRAPLSRERS